MSIVPISVVRIIIIFIVGVIIQEGTSKKEITIVPETISVIKMPSALLGVPQSYGHQNYARQTHRNGHRHRQNGHPTMPTTKASTMAASSSAVSKCGGRHDR